ncbi:MAG TPA: hypothetical protein VGX28_08190 [Frankiaceae bacterium]|jgi:hypothetical protein|nr:hypothetical protein [Frankiaceae bacterium]
MRRVATVAAGLAAVTAAPAVAAEPPAQYGPWTATTSVSWASYRIDAACVFGPMIVGEPPQLYVTGVASAPGSLSTTVRCYLAGTTLPGSVAAFSTRMLWDSPGDLCVTATAVFPTSTVTTPTRCVAAP